jgi:hypothetical protein
MVVARQSQRSKGKETADFFKTLPFDKHAVRLNKDITARPKTKANARYPSVLVLERDFSGKMTCCRMEISRPDTAFAPV